MRSKGSKGIIGTYYISASMGSMVAHWTQKSCKSVKGLTGAHLVHTNPRTQKGTLGLTGLKKAH